MSLKAKIEAIIYAAEEPITLEQVTALVKDMVLAEEATEAANAAARAEAEAATAATETAAEGEAPAESAEEAPAESAEASTEAPARAEEAAAEPVAEESSEAATVEAASDEPAPAESASVEAPDATAGKKQKKEKEKKEVSEDTRVKQKVRAIIDELISEFEGESRGIEIKQVAGGYRMATKPEHHDVVRAFAKSLKPPIRLSLASLETLAVVAYKGPITVPEISEIRGVESAGVIGTLLDRKLITTAGRKQVIGRPILYKTTKEFLLRFGLKDLSELPSMEEFEKLTNDGQGELFTPPATTEAGAQDAPAEPQTPPAEAGEEAAAAGIPVAEEALSAEEQAHTAEATETEPAADAEDSKANSAT